MSIGNSSQKIIMNIEQKKYNHPFIPDVNIIKTRTAALSNCNICVLWITETMHCPYGFSEKKFDMFRKQLFVQKIIKCHQKKKGTHH